MNQLITKSKNSKTIMRQNLRKRKPRLMLRAAFLALCALIFVVPAKAQTNVYMHSGTQNVTGTLNFYDSGGASSVDGSYYWEKWYQHNENATIVFKNGDSPIQVTFGQFHAWGDKADGTVEDLGLFSLRVNNDHLYVYDGENADDEKLICDLTGTLIEPFTLTANGPITFKFVSDGQYRDEGWAATVTSTNTYTVQQPIITKEVCSDYVIIYNTANGGQVYYTTGGNDPVVGDPLTGATLYNGPFSIDLDDQSASVIVKAVVVAGDNTSAVASHTFTHGDQRPTPDAPEINISGNTVTFVPDEVPAGLNETYNIRYTTDGSEPSATNGNLLTKNTGFSIEWHTPNTTFKAVTVAVTCSSKVSAVTEEDFENVTVPTPTITFGSDGKATITCSLDDAVIYYTTNGSTPTSSSAHGTTPVTTDALNIGTTVYAYAVFNAEGYDDSDIASAIYVPEGGSNTYGSVVFLDDREPHTLSYYTSDSPIHSLNPRDIKITYFGNGQDNNNMTTTDTKVDPTSYGAKATGVKVGLASTENQDEFIYLKTLEAANENGTGGYPYTAIPNPFQVRPTGQSNGSGSVTPTTRTVYISGDVYGGNNNVDGLIQVTYTDANDNTQTWSTTTTSYQQNVTATITVKAGTTLTVLARGRYRYYGTNYYSTVTARYDNSNGTQIASATATNNNYQNGATSSGTVNAGSSQSVTFGIYRGFYAWRIKRLSNGLTISGKQEGDVVYADEEITFETSKEEGNEVEFEALWAQALVSTSTSTSNFVSDYGYERNFMVLTNASGTSVSGLSVPCTVSAYYPNGTNGSTTSFISGSITCGADLKIENIRISGDNSTMTANNHDLIIGRGVTAYNTRCASMVRGIGAATSESLDYTIRIESGTFRDLSCLKGTWNEDNTGITCSGSSVHVNTTLGSDYDRAKKDNAKLSFNANDTDIEFGSAVTLSNIDLTSNTLFFDIKSGKIGRNDLEIAEYGVYIGISRLNSARSGVRKMLVEGGDISNIAGGVDPANPETGTSLYIRMKGGTVRGAIYGSGAFAAASGNRQMVFTGGKVGGWIAAGCNGTSTTQSGGVLPSDTYIYIGDDTEVGNKDGSTPPTINTSVGGNVFGAGSGNTTYETTGQVNDATVVVADSCYIQNNVFGGGNYGYTSETANIHVLGGTVGGSVFGGSNQKLGNVTNITMTGGKVTGNIYGGSNITGTVSGLATINVSGGEVTNVFGGGCGSGTVMSSGTKVTVSGGTINENIYGGGEEGTVTAVGTQVTFSGGTVNDIYGAGKGNTSPFQRANITGSTQVSVEGGTVNGSVYGGGQNGTVAYAANGNNNTNYNSTVGVKGGEVKGNVYGGGKMGTSQVATFVNISNGIIRGHVFGGAEGEQKKVFVTGQRTVNMTGGHVYGNVYGGSQNANDGNNTTLPDSDFANSTATNTVCVTNISGGIIDENVYAAGYFGNCFGSVYVFIGKDAINNAPYKSPTTGIDYKVATLSITGTVWAGGDWGTFQGNFGDPTISGNSNIYVDGNGYETTTTQASNAQYMNIGSSVLACGTSCHAGKAERTVIIRNYGTAAGSQPTEASRSLYSIQFAKVLIIDNSNINFTGQGRANDLNQTEKYSLYEIYNNSKSENLDTDVDGVRIVNGTGIFLNAPVTQIANFRSMSCENTFASTTPTLNGYTAITPTTLSSCNNQVRVNDGNYIEIKWGSKYGALIGYSHMMASTDATDGTCAYARPRWCDGAAFDQNGGTDNPNDGGWISYTASENTFALNGTAGNVQMPYENHTVAKNGEQYFRIWRIGGIEHYREGIFNANAKGTDTWKTVDVVITLPAFRDPANYYCFETNGDATTIDYGADVLMWNAARENGTGDDWMYFNEDNDTQMSGQAQSVVDGTLTEMKKNADVNFGLVILPATGMAGSDYIICYEADNNLALSTTKYTKADNTKEPQVRFRLTYYDKLSSNMTWDPSTIVLVQKDANGNIVDRVIISLAVSTTSTIEQEFSTKLYAIMQGKGSTAETFNAKVVLPSFAANLYTPGVASNFKLTSVNFVPANGGNLIARASTGYNLNDYAVGYAAGLNYDNSDGWNAEGNYTEQDAKPMTANNPTATSIGKTTGRTEFAIDFTLHYDGSQTVTTEELIGTLTFNFTFDNYKDENGNEVTQPLTIVVEVYRRGQGTRFYIDGINGSNANDAKHPDKAVKQLSTIFNRCGYMAGDEIYIVNQVTANKQLNWNGLPYSNVIIYRYNGGHELSAVDASIVGNPNNTAYLGNLLNVTNHMTMTGITLDGYYNNGETTPETDANGGPHTVTATASMITIANGGTLELSLGTVLCNNNSSSVNGSAVNVANGGKLMMNKDAIIKENVTTGDGGGVYMAGTMVVSDDIQIINNKKGAVQNNVFLSSAEKTITIGTTSGSDAYDALSADAKIGVTKALGDSYTSVVNVDELVDVEWLETPYNTHPNSIIYHDLGKYQLVKYEDPRILYWVGTWVTLQDHKPTDLEGGWTYPDDITNVTSFDITTQYQYAWIISLVNGENNQPGNNFSGKTVNILADLDMDESIWVPIGNERFPFKGTINGNGHLIENMHSSLVQNNMGMIGIAENATIQDVMAKVEFKANVANVGAVAGTMKGTTTISNVEAGGIIEGGGSTVNMGGIAGEVQSGTIHSSFAVNDLKGTTETVMGGLVGTNGGDLYNSFANVTMTGSNKMGGLVGENKAGFHVENCYVNLGQMEMPSFAYENHGHITYCYASKAGQYVSPDVEGNMAPTKSGIFSAVKGIKEIGYMYYDNLVTAPAENTYANHEEHEYPDHHTVVWNGLLSVLNEWVDNTEVQGDFSSWHRPTTQALNSDLPVLAFPKDNCLGNFAEEDGKFLRYSAFDLDEDSFDNGLDHLFAVYSGKAVNIFLYDEATDVVNGSGNANLFINEDAVLLQKATNDEYPVINATVGITFDNSDHGKTSYDLYGNKLLYDWHMMSTPLANALLGATYDESATMAFGTPVNIQSLEGSYFPNGLISENNPAVGGDLKWDLYSYFEPQYHWINLKRSTNNHWHIDGSHEAIVDSEGNNYQNETIFVPGKGYMMAINQDSYLSSTGVLNTGGETIEITNQEPLSPTYNKGWNLVGNPYQAYLDLTKVTSTKNQFYIYDAEQGLYVPYTVGQSANSVTPSRYIHPHQAFFMYSAEASSEYVFNYAWATADKAEDGSSYFRGEENQLNYPLVNLFAENQQGNRDLTIIEFNRPELGGASKVKGLHNADFKIAASLDGLDYGILFTPEGTERIPVHFQTEQDGTYTLTWDMQNGDFTSLRLIDNKTGVNYDMLANDSYTFEASADDFTSRFYITYTVTGLDEEVVFDSNSFAFFNGSEWVINGKGRLDVIDMTGRVLYAAQLSSDQNRVNLDGFAKGVYLLRVIDNKVVRTQKIIVR